MFNLKDHTILLTLSGSRAYGTHTETSDLDLKGVAIPPENFYLGFLDKFAQADSKDHIAQFTENLLPEEQDLDREGTIYELGKFVHLATQCNPNILDVLFCRDEDVRVITEYGEVLRDHRDMVISAKAKHTFSGYATSQLKRIKSHKKWLMDPPTRCPERADFGLPERTVIPKDQLAAIHAAIQKKMDTWELDLSGVDPATSVYVRNQIETVLAEITVHSDVRWFAAARAIGLNDSMIEILEVERKYLAAKRNWNQYQNWKKTRNKDRAALEAKHGYDTKHASHLVRLFRMGLEIMTTGKVNVWRGNIDADELLAIRAGAWKYDQLIEFAEAKDKELNDRYRSGEYVIPKNPNRKDLDYIVCNLIREYHR